MIYMLAIAMTLTMMIATAIALVNEADRMRTEKQLSRSKDFRRGRS